MVVIKEASVLKTFIFSYLQLQDGTKETVPHYVAICFPGPDQYFCSTLCNVYPDFLLDLLIFFCFIMYLAMQPMVSSSKVLRVVQFCMPSEIVC